MHRVVALIRPVQSTFEIGCAVEVFGTPRPGVPQHYEFGVCTETPGLVPTSAGYAMWVPRDLSALDSADTVIVPGWLPVGAPLPDDARSALLRAHARGARLVTICSGVFALARTGLLDGRTATTHPARADQLRREFPRVRVCPEQPYVDHGDVATSAGAGAALDLCLHLVGKDHGPAHAALLADSMRLPPPAAPPAGVPPAASSGEAAPRPAFSAGVSPRATSGLGPAAPGASRAGTPPHEVSEVGASARGVASAAARDALDGLLEWAGARLGTPLSIGDLAAHLGVSPRTLARRFADQLGTSPGEWLLSRRVAEACALLENTDLPVEAIAARVGLASAVNLRRRFRTRVGTTPSSYRREFRP